MTGQDKTGGSGSGAVSERHDWLSQNVGTPMLQTMLSCSPLRLSRLSASLSYVAVLSRPVSCLASPVDLFPRGRARDKQEEAACGANGDVCTATVAMRSLEHVFDARVARARDREGRGGCLMANFLHSVFLSANMEQGQTVSTSLA